MPLAVLQMHRARNLTCSIARAQLSCRAQLQEQAVQPQLDALSMVRRSAYTTVLLRTWHLFLQDHVTTPVIFQSRKLMSSSPHLLGGGGAQRRHLHAEQSALVRVLPHFRL